MAQLRLHFLGPPRLERDGQIVEPDTRKATALLAYLALGGERPSRDALAAFLWPDFDDSRAKAALRRTLSALKTTIGEEALYATREVIGLEMTAVWCDVFVFRQLLDKGDWETAVTLYRDDFLSGFSLRDSLPFDDWQRQQAEHLRRGLSEALALLVQKAIAGHEFDRGIAFARQWLQLDSLREEVHCQLMRLYAWSGRRSAALRQYRDCLRVLEEELGVSPLAETTSLYEAIQSDNLAKPPRQIAPEPAVAHLAHTAVSTPPAVSAPFIGRATELEAIQQLYRRAAANGRFLGITGEAGIGKTRLAETFIAAQPHAVCLRVLCYESETKLAYAPIVSLLRQALDQPDRLERLAAVAPPWLAEVARLLPDLHFHFLHLPTPPPLDWPGAPGRFLEGISQALAALLGGPAPGIFWLDDVQWADSATLDLLTFLVRRWQQYPILTLACWRVPDLPQNHRLYQLLAETRHSGGSMLLSLDRFTPGEVTALLAQWDTAVSPIRADRLYQETEGLPFLVAAYLQAQADPELADSWTLPSTARDLFQSRLARVGETGLQLLQAAAVIGRPFAFDLLLAASGRSEEEVISGLEGVIARQILVEQLGGLEFDFSHHKLRDLVYEEMSLVRRRLLHRRVAQALSARRTAQADMLAGQIAGHFHRAGQEAEAAVYYRRAGDYARTLFAHRDALTQYEAALALGHPETAVLHEICGDLHVRLGEYTAALASYERAASAASAALLPHLEHKIGQVHYRRGEWKLAEHHFAQAEAGWQATAVAPELAQLYIDWSGTALKANAFSQAVQLASQAQTLAAAPAVRAQTHNLLGILARHQKEWDEALRYFRQSLALAEEHDLLDVQITALNNLALTETAVGQLAAAQDHFTAALQHCLAYGDRHWEAALHSNLADLLHQQGEKEAAMAQLKTAVTIYADIGQEHGEWQAEIWKFSEW